MGVGAKVTVGHGGRLFLAPPPRAFAEAHACLRVLEEMRGHRVWERSDGESEDEQVGEQRGDEIADEDLAAPNAAPAPHGARHAEELRHLEAEVLRRRYGDAVLSMSGPVDLATATVRLGATTRDNGPLWEVSRAASDAELPNVLRHFRGPSEPLRGVYLRVVPPAGGTASAEDDDTDEEMAVRRREGGRVDLGSPQPVLLTRNGNDAQEIRRQFDRVQQQVHKLHEEEDREEEDLEHGGSAAKSSETASETAHGRGRQCLGCKVRGAMQRLDRNYHERPSGPEIADLEGADGESAHRNSKAPAAQASHLNAIEKARAHATMLMLSGTVSTHDNMRFVVPSTAANIAWYEEPAMSSAQDEDGRRHQHHWKPTFRDCALSVNCAYR